MTFSLACFTPPRLSLGGLPGSLSPVRSSPFWSLTPFSLLSWLCPCSRSCPRPLRPLFSFRPHHRLSLGFHTCVPYLFTAPVPVIYSSFPALRLGSPLDLTRSDSRRVLCPELYLPACAIPCLQRWYRVRHGCAGTETAAVEALVFFVSYLLVCVYFFNFTQTRKRALSS